MMCAQNVRRQLRDQQAGISGLSRQPFPLSNKPSQAVFLQIFKEDLHTTPASRPRSFQGLPEPALP